MAEPAQRGVGALPHEGVELVGVGVVEELLDLALDGDLGSTAPRLAA